MPRWLGLVVAGFLALSAGCGKTADVGQPSEVVTYRVRGGDTLSSIASKRSCTVAQLREWNHLSSDDLVPGQILEIHRGQRSAPVALGAGAPRKPGTHHVARGELVDPGDAPVKVVVNVGPEDGGGVGLLGAFDEASQALDRKIDGGTSNAPASAVGTSSGLAARGDSLGSAGTADKLDLDATPPGSSPRAPAGPVVGTGAISAPKLPKAVAQKCLSGPAADALGEDDAVESQGLTVDQIRGGMRAPLQAAARCLPAGTRGSFQVVVEVTAGCNGLVTESTIADAGGLPRAVTDCIAATVAQAGFPAHALPDGATFLYPIRFAAE